MLILSHILNGLTHSDIILLVILIVIGEKYIAVSLLYYVLPGHSSEVTFLIISNRNVTFSLQTKSEQVNEEV